VNIYRNTSFQRKSQRNALHRVRTIILSLVVSLTLLFSMGCASRNKTAISVDRNDPESVLRAHFDAWDRNDWSFRASMMDERYGHITPEPVEYVRLLELQPVPDSSSPDRTYQVVFEIKVKSIGSMDSGRYHWTYTLSWDANRGSWLITNYGAG
jgi:hypothetical protein